LQCFGRARQGIKAVRKFLQNYGSVFSPKPKLLFSENLNSLIGVFLAQVHQHKTEPCFVTKFPEGHYSLRLKNNIYFEILFGACIVYFARVTNARERLQRAPSRGANGCNESHLEAP